MKKLKIYKTCKHSTYGKCCDKCKSKKKNNDFEVGYSQKVISSVKYNKCFYIVIDSDIEKVVVFREEKKYEFLIK